MDDQFRVVLVPPKAPDMIKEMGTKSGSWYYAEDKTRWLFKAARDGTGEDWAEKIAAELCHLLNLPHARYELAEHNGRRGVTTPTFVPRDARLLLGNEILYAFVEEYPVPAENSNKFRKVPQHTISAVLKAQAYPSLLPPDSVLDRAMTPSDVFCGYLLLDAWVGNTDRHHENWGWVIQPGEPGQDPSVRLAVTFDHASSLGCHDDDESKCSRLATADCQFTVAAYVEKAKSKLYNDQADRKPLTTVGAFEAAAKLIPRAARAWLYQLEMVSDGMVQMVLDRMPAERMSKPSRDFAQAMLRINRDRLLRLKEILP